MKFLSQDAKLAAPETREPKGFHDLAQNAGTKEPGRSVEHPTLMQCHQNFPQIHSSAGFCRVEGSRKPRPSWQVVTRLKAPGGGYGWIRTGCNGSFL